MHFTDKKAEEVKEWVIKKLENISDADSEVLGEYVLALIRSDASDDEIRKTSVENLEDFLKDNTVPFVDEIFTRFGPPPVAKLRPAAAPFIPSIRGGDKRGFDNASIPTGPANSTGRTRNGRNDRGGTVSGSRKRSFHEAQSESGHENRMNMDERTIKQPRTRRGKQFPGQDARAQRQMAPGQTYPNGRIAPGMAANGPMAMPGFNFNPNDPMAAFFAMQAMGFPMPALPPMPVSGDVANAKPGQRKQRCIKYDTEGVCLLGAACPFEHASGPSNVGDRSRGNERQPQGRQQRKHRADFSARGPSTDPSITTLVIEHIPDDKCEESAVRDFFSAFGAITEVTMEPYQRLALIKYETHESAKKAWASPKAIFDNRFVKCYWLKSTTTTTSTSQEPQEPELDMEKFQQQQAEAQKAYEERMQKLKEAEDQRRELEQKRTELMQRHAEEKAKLMKALGTDDVAEYDMKGDDTEKKKDESEQTRALRAQLAALEEEAKSLGIDADASGGSYRGRGRGSFRSRGIGRGRGRGNYERAGGFNPTTYRGRGGAAMRGRGGVMRLDNRPKRVAVSGVEFDASKDEALKQYLLAVGDFVSIDPDPTRSDSQIITFSERYVAEQLMYGTSSIPGLGKVDLTWVSAPAPGGASSSSSFAANNKHTRQDGEAHFGLGGDDNEMGGSGGVHDIQEGYGESKGNAMDAGMDDYDVAEEDEDRWGVGIM